MYKRSEKFNSDKIAQGIDAEASAWLAKRDRGLTAEEQDVYLQWLSADVSHAKAIKRHAAVLERMMQLYAWQPGQSSNPNPDLFKPIPNKVRFKLPLLLTAAAAVLVICFALFHSKHANQSVLQKSSHYLKENEVIILPDGSRVELKEGSAVVEHFTASERRVRLTGGEAQFKVFKDAARPFYVEVEGIEIRAVGTAFNVKLDDRAVEVVVTEGKVKVLTASNLPHEDGVIVPMLTSGQKAVVSLRNTPERALSKITPLSADEISKQLEWQAPRLNFHETYLADAVAEFNRLNEKRQIVIADPAINTLKIGGTFRSDNVDGFVRLLNTTMGIKSDASPEGRIILKR